MPRVRSASIVCAVAAIAACARSDPAGTYRGTITRSVQTTLATTDLRPDGTSTARSGNDSRSSAGEMVTVTRVDATHLDIVLGGCRVRLEESGQAGEAAVIATPPQRCPIHEADFSGDATVSGTVSFARGRTPSLDVTLYETADRGDPQRAGFTTANGTVTFHGERSGR